MIRLNVFIQVEERSDEKALDVHMKAPHFVTLVPRIESLAKMKLEKFEF